MLLTALASDTTLDRPLARVCTDGNPADPCSMLEPCFSLVRGDLNLGDELLRVQPVPFVVPIMCREPMSTGRRLLSKLSVSRHEPEFHAP